MAKCEICEKTLGFGKKHSITRSRVSKRTNRTWKPNIKSVKTIINGTPKKINVCTKCLRSGKVEKA